MAEQNEQEQAQQAVAIDLDQLDVNLLTEDVTIDTDANPMDAPPPPPDKVWRVKVEVDAADFKVNTTNPKPGSQAVKQQYIAVTASATIVEDGPYSGRKFIIRENTLVFNNKNRMAYIILQALGGSQNPEAVAYVKTLNNFGKLALGFRDTFAAGRTMRLKSEWAAQYKVNEKGKDVYKTLKTGMKNFKPVPGKPGEFNHKLDSPAGEVAARAEIRDYYPDGV